MKTVDYKKRRNMMREYQEEIAPFTPTVREVMRLWGLRSTSSTHRCLQVMEAKGLVISRSIDGRYKNYYAP